MREIRAAGGVIWRADMAGGGESAPVRIAIVHRNRYDDWSLPKGKVSKGEHALAAAVREVREETGVTGVPQVRLPSTHYLTGEPDTEKTVDFWAMQEFEPSTFVTNDEVDELRWVTPPDAQALLTYGHDRGVAATFAAYPLVTAVAVFLRHARAGRREAWMSAAHGRPDRERPLDEVGAEQARALAPLLSLFKPEHVYSAPLVRCVDSVAAIGRPVETDAVFAEDTAAPAEVVADRLRTLATNHRRVVISSQGGVIPGAVAALHPSNAVATDTYHTEKGSGWVLSFSGPELVAADRLEL
jgi:8-oxo-dGTP diphosphatase